MGTFHPDHDELHGYTVVITTSTPTTYIGRWYNESEDGRILLNDASIHNDGENETSSEDFIKKSATWGVSVTQPQAIVERAVVKEIRKLGDVAKEVRGW